MKKRVHKPSALLSTCRRRARYGAGAFSPVLLFGLLCNRPSSVRSPREKSWLQHDGGPIALPDWRASRCVCVSAVTKVDCTRCLSVVRLAAADYSATQHAADKVASGYICTAQHTWEFRMCTNTHPPASEWHTRTYAARRLPAEDV